MKKTAIIILALVMTLSVCSCGVYKAVFDALLPEKESELPEDYDEYLEWKAERDKGVDNTLEPEPDEPEKPGFKLPEVFQILPPETDEPEEEVERAEPKVPEIMLPQVKPSEPVTRELVSDVLEVSEGYKEDKSTVYIQDPADYFGTAISYTGVSTSKNYSVRKFTGSADDCEKLRAYMDAITSSGHNLKRLEDYYQTYDSGKTFFSFCADYTGTGYVSAKTEEPYKGVKCTIMLYGSVERGKLKAALWIPGAMDMVDLGLRYDGENAAGGAAVSGESAAAGLYKCSDGSYITTDERFEIAGAGRAVVYRDGEKIEATARFARDEGGQLDRFFVEDFYRDEYLYLALPAKYFRQGDVLTLDALCSNEELIVKNGGQLTGTVNRFSSYYFAPIYAMHRSGQDIAAIKGEGNIFSAATVRFLCVEPKGETVVYFYAEFPNSPKTVEAVACFSLSE